MMRTWRSRPPSGNAADFANVSALAAQDVDGKRGDGRGFAFARYKNLAAYCAIALTLRVEHETGQIRLGRVVAAVDSGQEVNPVSGAAIDKLLAELYATPKDVTEETKRAITGQ